MLNIDSAAVVLSGAIRSHFEDRYKRPKILLTKKQRAVVLGVRDFSERGRCGVRRAGAIRITVQRESNPVLLRVNEVLSIFFTK